MSHHFSKEFLEEQKHKLIVQKAKLEEELANLPVHEEVGRMEDENATSEQLDELHGSLRIRFTEQLAAVEAALQALHTGDYGLTSEGQPISEKRLAAIPWATTDVE